MINETLGILLDRKSIRSFEQKELSDKQKDQIIAATLRAPTAGNQMLYTILVIDEKETKARLSELCDNQPFISQAPFVLVFLADCKRWLDLYASAGANYRDPGPADLLLSIEDAMIAAHASVVAADSLGLGSCYIGDIIENKEEIEELLNLEKYVFPISLVVYGIPTEQQKKRTQTTRFDKKYIVQYNRYRPLTNEERRSMLKAAHPEKSFDFNNWVKAFCNRKYMSDFSIEMDRSVREYLKQYLESNQ